MTSFGYNIEGPEEDKRKTFQFSILKWDKTNKMFPIIHLLIVFDFILQYDSVGFLRLLPEQSERVPGYVLTLNRHDCWGGWRETDREKVSHLLHFTSVRFCQSHCLSFIPSQTNTAREKTNERTQRTSSFSLPNVPHFLSTVDLDLRQLLSVQFSPLKLFLLRVRKSNTQNQTQQRWALPFQLL